MVSAPTSGPQITSTVGATTALQAAKTASYPCVITWPTPVSDFDATDLTVINGVVSKFTGVSGSATYSFTLTPGEGMVSVQFDHTKATVHSVTGSAYSQSSNLFTRLLDSTQPKVDAITSPMFQLGTGATAGAATVSGGAVTAIAVSAGGSNYVTPPTVTIVPDAADTITTPAAATAVLTNGVVTSISITTAGVGYAHAPTVILRNGVKPMNGASAVTRVPVKVTFSEPPKAFPSTAVVASAFGVDLPLRAPGGGVGGPVLVSGSTWQFELAIPTNMVGGLRLVVPSQAVQDTATNPSAASGVYDMAIDLVNGTPVDIASAYTDG
jgi:hypothetical protein